MFSVKDSLLSFHELKICFAINHQRGGLRVGHTDTQTYFGIMMIGAANRPACAR